jgi:Cytochrome B561, N terminal
MDQWQQNMRSWLSNFVIQPRAREFEMSEMNFDILASELVKQNGAMMSRDDKKALSSSQHNRRKIDLIMTHMSNHPEVKRRAQLERYLEVATGKKSSKEYVLKRIYALAVGHFLEDFRWDSGTSWNGQPWEPSLPTDAQIVMHCFFTFMDETLFDFTQNHFREYSNKKCK